MAPEGVAYWDASAVLSALVRDEHSDQAVELVASDRVISSRVSPARRCQQSSSAHDALRTELAELVLLTFDTRLDAAAQGEGLAP